MAFIEDTVVKGMGGLFKNGFKLSFGSSLMVGLGALVLGPVVVQVVSGMVRPVAKAAIKGGIILYSCGMGFAQDTGKMAMGLVKDCADAASRVAESKEERVMSPEVRSEAPEASGHVAGGSTSGTSAEPAQWVSAGDEEAEATDRSGVIPSAEKGWKEPERPKPWIVRGY